MKIKEILKVHNIKLSEFADLLKISRPTLNNYIKEYEETNLVSNQIYSQMFDELFKKSNLDSFKDTFNKWTSILKGEENFDNYYSLENLELMKSIKTKMKLDLKGLNEVSSLYKFLNSTLYNYGSNLPLTTYINYNLYLNGLKSLEQIKGKEKKLISHLYPLMKKFTESNLNYNEGGYNLFLERVKEIHEDRKNYIDKEIIKKLKKEIVKQIELGINPENVNIEEILKNLK